MQKQKIILVLALLATASALLALAAGAAAQGQSQMNAGLTNVDIGNIDTIYHAVAVTGMDSDSLSFNVLGTVIKGKDGSMLKKDMMTPIPVRYFFANNSIMHGEGNTRLYDEFRGFTRTDYDAAALNVAGASAVTAAKDIDVRKQGDGVELHVKSFSVYLPDGTVRSYSIDNRVSFVMPQDISQTTVTGNPNLRAAMQDAFKGDAKFPADAAPVKIKDIDAKM